MGVLVCVVVLVTVRVCEGDTVLVGVCDLVCDGVLVQVGVLVCVAVCVVVLVCVGV